MIALTVTQVHTESHSSGQTLRVNTTSGQTWVRHDLTVGAGQRQGQRSATVRSMDDSATVAIEAGQGHQALLNIAALEDASCNVGLVLAARGSEDSTAGGSFEIEPSAGTSLEILSTGTPLWQLDRSSGDLSVYGSLSVNSWTDGEPRTSDQPSPGLRVDDSSGDTTVRDDLTVGSHASEGARALTVRSSDDSALVVLGSGQQNASHATVLTPNGKDSVLSLRHDAGAERSRPKDLNWLQIEGGTRMPKPDWELVHNLDPDCTPQQYDPIATLTQILMLTLALAMHNHNPYCITVTLVLTLA